MNLKSKYWSLIWIFLFCLNVQAQDTGIHFYTLNENSNRLTGKLQGRVYYIDLIGNANYFLQKDWVNASIVLKDGEEFKNINVRYMSYNDEIVAYNENNRKLFILDKSMVRQFSYTDVTRPTGLTERKFVNLDSLQAPQSKTFFEEIYSGTPKLLVFHSIREKKVKPFTDASGRLADTVFEPESKYYIYSVAKGFVKINLRNRWFINVFTENKKEIRKQLRKVGINVKNEPTAVQALELLENLGLIN